MLYTPKEELAARICNLQGLLREKGIDGALIVQSIDLFYFSGTAQNAHLYIPAEGDPLLMARKSAERAFQESALENKVAMTSLKKMPELLAAAQIKMPAVLGLEMDVLPANNYLLYLKVFADARMVDASGLIRQVRQIKSPYELELLRTSARKIDLVYQEIPRFMREGMAEIELAAKIEGMARSAGHMGFISMRSFNHAPFFGHLMAGWTGAVPSAFDGVTGGPGMTPVYPQSGGFKPIGRGEPLIVDYVGLWDGYITDQTRIYAIGGLPEKMMRAMDIALKIQSAIVKLIKPGVDGGTLHELALEMAADAGLADNFMGYGPDQARFIGHGVGLELDELPVLAKGLAVPLEAGMVFALEPKFVFPGEGTVGIENTFALTAQGVEKITITPDEIVIVD